MYYYRLKDLREDKDLTQKEIADIIKTSGNYYGEYESGKRDIPFERVIELAKFYDVSLDYIAERINEKGGLKASRLDQEEKRLLELFRGLNQSQKNLILELLRMIGQKAN